MISRNPGQSLAAEPSGLVVVVAGLRSQPSGSRLTTFAGESRRLSLSPGCKNGILIPALTDSHDSWKREGREEL